ncbi:acyltransferase [Patescibacteria group bacterium]|nr:acyltransferase [Patescibacteria group bacterium]
MSRKRFKKWEYPIIENGKMTKYNWLVQYKERLKLGKFTDIGAFTYINAKFGVVIGDNVQIGSHCAVYSYSTIDNKRGKVIIKENACIGSHSTVMPGVSIGKNSIIGAHSMINSDIPDNVVAFGVPANVVKKLVRK